MPLKQANTKKWLNGLTWVLLFGFFFSISNYFQPTKYALLSACVDTIALYIIYTISYRVIFPRYYSNFRTYIIISAVFVIVYAFIYYYIDIELIPHVNKYEFKHPPQFFIYFRMLMTSSFFYFVGTSTSLIEHNQRLVENEKLLTGEKLETELKLLKAQINPHFIFNALNNIYSLTYMQAKNAPDAVLKLSEMLRYVFYDCSKDKVRLCAEIKYIENFIAFQQMKSEYKQKISIKNDSGIANIEIAPMLFIPFIENAFKYSRIEENEEAYVNIAINKKDHQLLFSIENSVPTDNIPLSGSGTGIKNVKHRLAIIYAGKHQLNISDEKSKFTVHLSVDI